MIRDFEVVAAVSGIVEKPKSNIGGVNDLDFETESSENFGLKDVLSE